MDLRGTIRQAEQQVVRSARRGAELAKAGVQAVENSILHRASIRQLPMSAHPEQEPDASGQGSYRNCLGQRTGRGQDALHRGTISSASTFLRGNKSRSLTG